MTPKQWAVQLQFADEASNGLSLPELADYFNQAMVEAHLLGWYYARLNIPPVITFEDERACGGDK